MMKIVLISLVFFIDAQIDARNTGLQIRNGEDAQDGEFPYMVEIRKADRCFICGGTIIAKNWILTAGHCIDEDYIGESGNYSIVYGTKWLHDCLVVDPDPDTVINVKVQHRHPNWSGNGISGLPSIDLGLLELEEEIVYGDYAQPISLADDNNDVPVGVLGNLTGWGSAVSGEYLIQNLQKIQLPVVENTECSSRIDDVDSGDLVSFNGTDFFCTDDSDNGSCNGDSGGPYVIDGIQYGIVSWSLKPCGSYPGVFTRVALPIHRDWIKNVTGV